MFGTVMNDFHLSDTSRQVLSIMTLSGQVVRKLLPE